MTVDSINEGIARMGTRHDQVTTKKERSSMPGIFSEKDWDEMREAFRKPDEPEEHESTTEITDTAAERENMSNDTQLQIVENNEEADEEIIPVRLPDGTQEYFPVSMLNMMFGLGSYLLNRTDISLVRILSEIRHAQSSQLHRSLNYLHQRAAVYEQNNTTYRRDSVSEMTQVLIIKTSPKSPEPISSTNQRSNTIPNLSGYHDAVEVTVKQKRPGGAENGFTVMSSCITRPESPRFQNIARSSDSLDPWEGPSAVRTLSDVTSATDHDVGAELTPRSPSVAKRDRNKNNSSRHFLDTSNPELVATVLRKSFGSSVERENTTSGHSRRDGEVRDLHYREGKCGWGIGIYQLAGESDEDWKRRQERQETECQTNTGETQEVTS